MAMSGSPFDDEGVNKSEAWSAMVFSPCRNDAEEFDRDLALEIGEQGFSIWSCVVCVVLGCGDDDNGTSLSADGSKLGSYYMKRKEKAYRVVLV